nr:hypothetical protein [Kibdelosporangium sp. MJ126-NF4]
MACYENNATPNRWAWTRTARRLISLPSMSMARPVPSLGQRVTVEVSVVHGLNLAVVSVGEAGEIDGQDLPE